MKAVEVGGAKASIARAGDSAAVGISGVDQNVPPSPPPFSLASTRSAHTYMRFACGSGESRGCMGQERPPCVSGSSPADAFPWFLAVPAVLCPGPPALWWPLVLTRRRQPSAPIQAIVPGVSFLCDPAWPCPVVKRLEAKVVILDVDVPILAGQPVSSPSLSTSPSSLGPATGQHGVSPLWDALSLNDRLKCTGNGQWAPSIPVPDPKLMAGDPARKRLQGRGINRKARVPGGFQDGGS